METTQAGAKAAFNPDRGFEACLSPTPRHNAQRIGFRSRPLGPLDFTSHPSPRSMMVAARRWPWSSIALAIFVVVLPYENDIGRLRAPALMLASLFIIWEGRHVLTQAPGSRLRAYGWIWCFAALYVLGVVFLRLAMVNGVGDEPATAGIAIEALRRLGPFAALLPPLFLIAARSTPAGQPRLGDGLSGSAPQLWADSPSASASLSRAMWIWLVLGLLWAGLACAWSPDWEESLELLSEESAPYILAYSLLVLVAGRGRLRLRFWMRLLVAIGAFVGALGVAQMIAGLYAPGSEWGEWLIENEIMNRRWNEYREVIWRAQFPFEEHNRLASYLTAAALLVPAASALEDSSRVRWMMYAGLALMLAGIYATGTRGAMMAVAAGLAVAALGRPRWLAALIVVGLLLAVASPQRLADHTRTIFQKETWTKPDGSVQYRVYAWRIAGAMIRDRPLTGHGYGWKTYEELFPEYRERPEFREFYERKMPHAHNNLLEIAVENGLIGASIYFVVMVLLLIMIVRIIWMSARGSPGRRLGWGFMGFMVAVTLYGITNYSLRRTVGYEIAAGFAMLHAALLVISFGSERAMLTAREAGVPQAQSDTHPDSSPPDKR